MPTYGTQVTLNGSTFYVSGTQYESTNDMEMLLLVPDMHDFVPTDEVLAYPWEVEIAYAGE